jgi:hypothetical protein
MTTQSELFDKAQACDQMTWSTSDLQIVAAYARVRDMWIELANDSVSMTPELLAAAIANISDMQSRIVAVDQK